jgi:hypothetical protein
MYLRSFEVKGRNRLVKLTDKIKFVLVVILMIVARGSVNAQRMALTTNLFEDAIATPNLGVDVVIADGQSISFDASFAPYKLSEAFHNKCMTYRAGYKFWFNQAFYAHYIGADLVVSSSDVGLLKWNFKDEYVGIGLCYGYAFIMNKRLNLVPHIGLGMAYGNRYEGYDHVEDSGAAIEAQATAGFKPIVTRLGVTLQYVLK